MFTYMIMLNTWTVHIMGTHMHTCMYNTYGLAEKSATEKLWDDDTGRSVIDFDGTYYMCYDACVLVVCLGHGSSSCPRNILTGVLRKQASGIDAS